MRKKHDDSLIAAGLGLRGTAPKCLDEKDNEALLLRLAGWLSGPTEVSQAGPGASSDLRIFKHTIHLAPEDDR